MLLHWFSEKNALKPVQMMKAMKSKKESSGNFLTFIIIIIICNWIVLIVVQYDGTKHIFRPHAA